MGPPHVIAAKAKALLPYSLASALLTTLLLVPTMMGLVLLLVLLPDEALWPVACMGSVFMAAGVLAMAFAPHILTRGRLLNAAHDQWRDHLIAQLSLEDVVSNSEPRVHFGMASEGFPGFTTLLPKWDAALLFVWPGGVAIFGAHGSRLVLGSASITRSVAQRMWVYPPRVAWKVSYDDGGATFASMDEPDFPTAAAAMRELAAQFARD